MNGRRRGQVLLSPATGAMRASARRLLLAVVMMLATESAARATTVTLEPPDTTVMVGHEFVVRAVTDAFPDLRAFELIYKYDSVHLEFVSATAGEVLTSTGSYFDIVVPDAPPADSVTYDAAVLGTSTSGPGILVYLRFKAIATGEAPIGCALADFRDSQNVVTSPQCGGGRVVVAVDTPTLPITWGRLKAIYR